MLDYFEEAKRAKLPKDTVILSGSCNQEKEQIMFITTKPHDRSQYNLLQYDLKTKKLIQIAKAKTPESLMKKF